MEGASVVPPRSSTSAGINAPPAGHTAKFSARQNGKLRHSAGFARGIPVAPSSHMPHAVLNGRDVSFPDAPTLADALRAIGVHLPALCHDERLEPTGACRLCLVRLNGARGRCPRAAHPSRKASRSTHRIPSRSGTPGTLQMLAAGYPAEAARADPDNPSTRRSPSTGWTASWAARANPAHVDRSHPYITVDMSRCIECYRCVRICDEVQGQFVWHLWDRGGRRASGRTGRPARTVVRQLRRLRRHLSDRRARRRDVRHARRADDGRKRFARTAAPAARWKSARAMARSCR